jgi:hypothetical protein
MAERERHRIEPRRSVLQLVTATIAGSVLAPAVAASTISREVNLQGFDRLVLEVSADVSIRIGSRNHARMEAEQKVVERIVFRNEGGTLKVGTSGSIEAREPITILIECTRLTSLEAHGSVEARLSGLTARAFELVARDGATVSLESLNLESLEADIGGSATVNASGKARAQEVSVGGAATYDARRLRSATARIEAADSSDVAVDSRETLEVRVSGSATVQFAGHPKLKQSVSDAGTLEPL